MRIKKIALKNFKRFSDLTISDIPETSKLVLLIGSNGSGKSSLFDAFDWLSRGQHKGMTRDWVNYYPKIKTSEPSAVVEFYNDSIIEKVGHSISKGNEIAKKFFGRSSIRIVPQITNSANPSQALLDYDSPDTYIQNDTRFVNDISLYIQNIDQALRDPVFRGEKADTLQIFKDSIEPLNRSFLNIFGGDKNTTIQIAKYDNPTQNEPAKLIFKKGSSEINYELLSHGEKQVVILLINFIVRQESYKDSIIFIDEMDCHLNTSLQYSLLEEIVSRWIPDNSQLWTASHALGFIDYANKSGDASIIDFDLLDFDQPQILTPLTKDYLDVYEIAVPKAMLSDIMKGKKIVFCENQNDEYYNLLALEDKIFVGVKDARDVFMNVKRNNTYTSIRDRDFLSDNEIAKIKNKYSNHNILKYRNFENYIYHPDNIAELNLKDFDKTGYIKEIIKQKNDKYPYSLANIEASRQSYEEFKTDQSFKDRDTKSIVDDFISNEFDRFYKFFDMKKDFHKSLLEKLNLSKEKLVQTKWLKQQIISILQ